MKPDPHIDKLLQAYFSGKATSDQVGELEDWLREDADHVQWFVDLALLDGLMLSEQKTQDAAAILSTLREAEESAEPDFSLLETKSTPEPEPSVAKATDLHIKPAEFFSLAGYLAAQAMKTKAGLITAAAAVLILGITLFAVFSGSNSPTPTMPAASAPPRPQASDELNKFNNSVATLTAIHNAAWSGPKPAGDLRRGDALYPNQRLTLTQGFAEITTNDGAVAILEAPATIELLNNDNAIRLHAGKLVGICETLASKGFVVHTPHMDVTDLGTRFGVEVFTDRQTEVHVIKGKVEVAKPAGVTGSIDRKVLETGQATRAMPSQDSFVDLITDATRFTQVLETQLIAGTGQGQTGGEADDNWRVVSVDGQPVSQHGEMIIVPGHHDGTSNPATSQWLLINEALNPPGKGSAIFTCRASIQLPETIDLDRSELFIRCSADFSVKALRVNGQAIDVPSNRIGVGNKWITLSMVQHATQGQNTIEVDVHEIFSNNGKPNSSSLRVEVRAYPNERQGNESQ